MNNSGFKATISGREIQADRPSPILPNIEVAPFDGKMDPQDAIDALLDGYYVLIDDFFSTGLVLLSELKKAIQSKYSDQSFQGQRDFRAAYRELSHRILLFVNKHKLTVRKAPEIGWLKILYPGLDEFLLPLPQVQGLNSSWQWYVKGIHIPVLNRKIHPFFGTYFPTRFEHLELFDDWLKQYQGEKKSAIDVGIGCGVLSFQMLKHGFGRVHGTDSNPNAIIGLSDEMNKKRGPSKIDLYYGDLFAGCTLKSELVVFNPPWLPASHDLEGIDKAIYYDETLFPRFFEEAKNHLTDNGKVVLLFSNMAQVTKVGEQHPIESELADGGRFQKELFLQKEVGAASKNTRRNQNWRASEKVELWVLKG
ncbi:MAG: methyltransferase [Bacteroidales bacterium]|nr:methyltransferase [Bacteroidales bacterium]